MLINCPVARDCQKALQNHKEAFLNLNRRLDEPGYVVESTLAVEVTFQAWLDSLGMLTPKTCMDCRSVRLSQALGVWVGC